ncbi:MAG TPA: VCBS repeat-containing protein, partial [Planctomycetota bacterium]|nr:VCBS repeat-containing protein [Planctomycetota bacterium]
GHLDLYIVNGSNLFRRHPEPIYNALNAVPNALYVSNGDGTFTDRTREAGVGHSGWGLAVTTADYDLDGDTDIFVGNDVGFDVLYRNRGDGTFDDVTQEAGIIYRGSTMSAAWGDLDGDGYPDLFAPAMDSNSRWMTRQPGFPSPAPWFVNLFLRSIVLDILNEMLYGNRLYMNNRDGTFREVADSARVRRNGWAWSGIFLDYDNDGDQDIFCCNGFVSGPERKDL